jgi:Fe-S-cluster containining protein
VKDVFEYSDGDEQCCEGCTLCCKWPGDVLFEPSVLPDLAHYLGMDESDCADMFFDLGDDRQHLKTKPTSGEGCVFVGENGCRVYPHRPQQCRTFPYTWQRPERKYMAQCRLYQAVLKREAGEK